jgi:hypothetical protein
MYLGAVTSLLWQEYLQNTIGSKRFARDPFYKDKDWHILPEEE